MSTTQWHQALSLTRAETRMCECGQEKLWSMYVPVELTKFRYFVS